MSEFIMDGKYSPEFADLDEFTQGYVECMFFTETEIGTDFETWNPETDSSLPGDCGFDDLAPKTLQRIIADCERFQSENADLLAQAVECGRPLDHLGHDFWLTRNGHGAGFWDRKELDTFDSAEYDRLTAIMAETYHSNPAAWHGAKARRDRVEAESLGEKLSAAARAFGEVWPVFGDDSKVYM